LNQVHDCIEEANICKEVKNSYRECLIEENVEFNKLKSMKEKSNDLVKVKNQEVIHEKRMKISEQVSEMVVKEFDYQEKLMEREYAHSIRQLINAYRNYFLSGAEVLNNLEKELLATTITPTVTPATTRSYNLKEIERVMSKQNEQQSKTIVSRAEVLEKRRVFGVDLVTVNQREHGYIPKIMTDLNSYIENHALDVEGIFRLAAGVPGLNKLKRLYDTAQVIDIDRLIQQKEIDIHVVSCILKLYLRELPAPVLSYELYDYFLAVTNDDIDDDTRIQGYGRLLQQLPHHNILLLDRILQMLTKVAENSSTNLMTCSNLSIVFGVNLMKSTDNSPLRVARDNSSVNKTCEILIKEYPKKLSGIFRALVSVAKQTRDLEIRQELENEKTTQTPEETEIRSTAPQVIAKEQILPPPSKQVTDTFHRRLPMAPATNTVVNKSVPQLPTKVVVPQQQQQQHQIVNQPPQPQTFQPTQIVTPPIPQRRTQSSSAHTPTSATTGFNPRTLQQQPPPQQQQISPSNPFADFSFDAPVSQQMYPNVTDNSDLLEGNLGTHNQQKQANNNNNPYNSNPYANYNYDDPF
jgi:hypothetical protein